MTLENNTNTVPAKAPNRIVIPDEHTDELLELLDRIDNGGAHPGQSLVAVRAAWKRVFELFPEMDDGTDWTMGLQGTRVVFKRKEKCGDGALKAFLMESLHSEAPTNNPGDAETISE